MYGQDRFGHKVNLLLDDDWGSMVPYNSQQSNAGVLRMSSGGGNKKIMQRDRM